MNIGFIGLGMLGLPMALGVALRGHRVRGFDADARRMALDWYPAPERGPGDEPLAAIAARSDFAFAPLDEVVAAAEIVFLTVQTPSAGGYDGTGRFPPGGVDYDLAALRHSLAQISLAAEQAPRAGRVLAVVSTVLPGTLRALAPLLAPASGLVLAHTPAFPAIGTIMRDFLAPEFFLVGAPDEDTGRRLETFFRTLADARVFVTGLENAELIKTSYNGYIGMKIGFANALMELAHKVPGCDVDAVVDCLSLATRRLMSPRYLRGGLGDGGGCHPKENAALAALAQRVELSFDPFSANLASRDRQTAWLADLVAHEQRGSGLPLWLLGTAFKPDVGVEDGSPALLLLAALRERGLRPMVHDPLVPGRANPPPASAGLFVLGVAHAALRDFVAAAGSIVVDPWRVLRVTSGVRLVAVGRAGG